MEITAYQLDMMKHAIGLDNPRWPHLYHRHRKTFFRMWRNCYCAGGKDARQWDDLACKGLALKVSETQTVFRLTDEGIETVASLTDTVIRREK